MAEAAASSISHLDRMLVASLSRTMDLNGPPSFVPVNEESQRLGEKVRKRSEYEAVQSFRCQREGLQEMGPVKPQQAQWSTATLVQVASRADGVQVLAPASSSSSPCVAMIGGMKVARRGQAMLPKPVWHAPWKLMRVISGHTGWVRSVSVDVSNEWFATGSADRTIKIWDLASGTLKLSLTGHLSPIRGLAVSDRHPYLFSAGEDKQVKCWDLEQNKVIRHYHGHLSGVYALALHPTLDLLVTAGRDSVARVWDMRTKQSVFVLAGHSSTIAALQCQAADPQVITGSMDSTIRLWDLKMGKTSSVLTHHKKSVRALAFHPREYAFASGSPDDIKKYQCPMGTFLHSFSGHSAIVNTLAVNEDNVLFSGADNGSISFWDWRSGYCFQSTASQPQPGSLESEAGIFASTFDRTGLRLITCEADKSIKIWKEDEDAQPINLELS